MSKQRIGLSLGEDVMEILNREGRQEKSTLVQCRICGRWNPVDREKCLTCETAVARDTRPTRTEIIEAAVRDWNDRREYAAMHDVTLSKRLSTKS